MGFYDKNDAIPATRTKPDSAETTYESELKPFGTRPLYAIHDLDEVVYLDAQSGPRFCAFTGPIILLYLVVALGHVVN